MKWRVPEDATWVEEFFFVCFDDDCPYYQNGWTWMEERYGQKASFRYAVNPSKESCLPIPVWSDSATREMIVDEEEGSES
jgi:hypothetical protein